MHRNFTFEISLRLYIYIHINIHRSRLYDDVSKFMKTRYRVFPLSKSYIRRSNDSYRGIINFSTSQNLLLILTKQFPLNCHFFLSPLSPFFTFFSLFSNDKKNLTIIPLLNERGAKTGSGAIYRKHFFEVEMKILVKLDIAWLGLSRIPLPR